jgi:hypothetical protein
VFELKRVVQHEYLEGTVPSSLNKLLMPEEKSQNIPDATLQTALTLQEWHGEQSPTRAWTLAAFSRPARLNTALSHIWAASSVVVFADEGRDQSGCQSDPEAAER